MLLARTPSRSTDDGSALVAVLGTMAVLVLFLVVTLTYAVQNLTPTRKDQDAKAALAAAQAGVDDYLSRLNADNNYWQTTDTANPAYTTGLALAGTGGAPAAGTPSCAGCSFTYERLGTVADVARTGSLRLRVTGRAGAATRTVVASLQPVGFLKYVYYTDVEAVDPELYSAYAPVTVDGSSSETNGTTTNTFIANPAWVNDVCAKRYWEGRVKPLSYTSTSSNPYYVYTTKSGAYNGTLTGGVGRNVVLTNGCRDLQWITGDVVDGPLHTNDALYITQAPLFTNSFSKAPAVETSWLDGSPVPPPAGGRWWGGGTPDPAGQQPVAQPLVELPDSNTALKNAAQTSGCVYTGATKITFSDTTMTVLSPNSATVNRSSCLNTATRSSAQTVPIPPAVYVQAGTGTACVGYPLQLPAAGTTPARTESKLGAVPDHTCSNGTAYVSGRLQGATTVGTDSDVVITGDLTYRSGTSGADVLGLIANNFVWVYHPVHDSGSTSCTPQPACRGVNMLTAAQEVHNVQAAILSLRHSFLVQSYEYGAPLDAGTGQKLNVTGSISQKFRGPVGTAGTPGTGYKKGYAYDKRLLAIPPPFFLQPKTTPWFVKEMSG